MVKAAKVNNSPRKILMMKLEKTLRLNRHSGEFRRKPSNNSGELPSQSRTDSKQLAEPKAHAERVDHTLARSEEGL